VHDAVNGPVGALRGELVVCQVERGGRKRVELRSGRPIAQVSRQQFTNPVPQLPQRAGCARETSRRIAAAITCTSRGKSSGPPGVGSAQTSSSSKSGAISWMRQGTDVCAVFGSLIARPPSVPLRSTSSCPRLTSAPESDMIAPALPQSDRTGPCDPHHPLHDVAGPACAIGREDKSSSPEQDEPDSLRQHQ
jgi:hypothetical protein